MNVMFNILFGDLTTSYVVVNEAFDSETGKKKLVEGIKSAVLSMTEDMQYADIDVELVFPLTSAWCSKR